MKYSYLGKTKSPSRDVDLLLYEVTINSFSVVISFFDTDSGYEASLERLDKVPSDFNLTYLWSQNYEYQCLASQVNMDELDTEYDLVHDLVLKEGVKSIECLSLYAARLSRLKELFSEENERLNDNTEAN